MSDTVRELMEKQKGMLPDLLGLEVLEAGHGRVCSRFTVQTHHMAPNGFLHAASIIALLDTAAGYGCLVSLPQGASGFTTIELKSNFLGTAQLGHTVVCEACLVHGGRQTQVWDAKATHAETHKAIALFRCTQMVLYPR
jgi:1,4-dihydroxy-2-naphthoyl-CoA hydrolase